MRNKMRNLQFYLLSPYTVKADQQSKASSGSSGEPMDITTPGDISKVLVSQHFRSSLFEVIDLWFLKPH